MAEGFGLGISLAGMPELLARLDAMAVATAGLGTSSVAVGTSISYGRFVHDGTRPHMIYPSAMQALYWPGAAHPVKSVHHPGYRGNPFLVDALTEQTPEIELRLVGAIDAVASGAPPEIIGATLGALGLGVADAAKERANVRTGALRDSIVSQLYWSA